MREDELLSSLCRIKSEASKFDDNQLEAFEAGEAACAAMEKLFLGRRGNGDPVSLFYWEKRRVRSRRLFVLPQDASISRG